MPVARLGVADVERWHARMRKTGVGEAAIRCRHSVLRAALAQALRWEWVGSNPASQARLRQPKRAATRSDDRRRRARRDRRGTTTSIRLRVSRCASPPSRGCAEPSSRRCQWTDLAGNQLTVDSSATIVRRDGESSVDDVATKTGEPPHPHARSRDGRQRSTSCSVNREAGLAVPLLRHDRARQSRSHRMVVDPSAGAIRDRPEVASARSAALDRDHRDHEWARRAHRRRTARPRQPGDDAAGLRARGRGCRSRARRCAR